ncbi:anhydro-N-acetylmuramic acid kinase [Lichenifustis flavocetrariae]|uniref:Anhydro-N-acetylmuramic acid kinase n=1 Tax=Lichenifustis flavocetrariae TaxID=2949735 RepID=A0AA41Z8B2_9HYPH|nr:anhydro-N-acetylmuramic acid kinase [Lichenifustis flavocetrariae]MCW6511127.1 anhydro-N-acetylmuramic acid kinase [Lichenifustis flavocetrariae]
MKAIGLMSGTSMDGIDIALLDTDGEDRITFGPTGGIAYDESDRTILRAALTAATALTDRASRPRALADAERRVTDLHADAVDAFLRVHEIDRRSIDVVGFHGQTVLHRPERQLTVQIGDGARLAEILGLPVVADLRAADVAAGGQGAPLVPVFHRALVHAAALSMPALIINIGGVSNITFIPATGEPIACDTGPGNALIDDLMLERIGQSFDRDGAAAGSGTVDRDVLTQLMRHPYFDAPLPKSLDRNAFSRSLVESLSTADAAATLTAFTAASIARSLRHLPEVPRLAVVCGGGARNLAMMQALATALPCPLQPAEALGWQPDAIEAQAFAYLAVRSLRGLPLTFPTTTGVPRPLSGGLVFRPADRAA